ncbi:MAG: T9SS type A sorting domain-containing protein [Bacteroidetes bacterium]|nr:T9SS type A sorting domain-containing protein [Bacteroidota bacterium]MBL6943108.1 T9SS type A sorting domain-containing protein [Bacteroidales bacterium]
MKRIISFLLLIASVVILPAQQITIDRIEQMPNIPQPYLMRDWKQVAHNYDSLVFNTDLSGEYLPLVGINPQSINYPEHESAAMVSYVGQTLGTSAEGINQLPAVVGATISGIDKSNQFGKNWALLAEDFFNNREDENVYLNHPITSSGNDWWYETIPNVFFYQLAALYPNTGDYNYQFQMVADRWLEAVDSMGGNTTPWQVPTMNYRAWNLKQMKPLTTGVKEPEAAGAIAWLLYNAYRETNEIKYLIGAEWSMEFLVNLDQNPSYELQLPYGTYTAACMNVEIGTNYDIEKMLNWCFNRGDLRGWGAIVGQWGDYDCSGLIGEANDAGNDYAFLMNGFQQAAALVPLLRYDEHYANAIGKWVLNMAVASRLFYPGFLPSDQQDSEVWSNENDPNKCIAHEALKEVLNGKSPFSTGDAIAGGWSPTNLALYGSSHVGYLGGIVDTTNVSAVLKLNLSLTDFYAEKYSSFLMWNPYDTDTSVTIDIGSQVYDIYNSINNSFMYHDVIGIIQIPIPASNSVIITLVPNGAAIEMSGKKTFANGIVIDFDNGEPLTDNPPRIKALQAIQNPVVAGDSIFVFCSAEDIDNDIIDYYWEFDYIPQVALHKLSIKSPDEIGDYLIKCRVSSGSGLSDSMNIILSVVERIPYIPEISSLKASPGKIDVNQPTTLSCEVEELNGDEVSYNWAADDGTFSGSGATVQWTSPANYGNNTIYCTVSDIDGESTDSITIMVRDLSVLIVGDPVLYLPFNQNVADFSEFNNSTSSENLSYQTDPKGNQQLAASFNGSSSFVSVENASWLNFDLALTLSGWIYSQNNSGGEAYPISHGNWDNRWKVSIGNDLLRFTINTVEGVYDLDSKTVIEMDHWYFFTMVYTGTDMELYIDGQLDAFITASGTINSTSYDLVLGKARPDQNYYFKGRLDDVYLFDHAIAPTDILEMYTEGVDNIYETKAVDLISIFPNPGNGQVCVRFNQSHGSNVDYQIIDITGRIISKNAWQNNNKSQFCINTSKIKPGTYIVEIQTGELVAKKKFIISQ